MGCLDGGINWSKFTPKVSNMWVNVVGKCFAPLIPFTLKSSKIGAKLWWTPAPSLTSTFKFTSQSKRPKE
jgi:hypothetical protein